MTLRYNYLDTVSSNNTLLFSLLDGWNKDFKPGKFPETEAERAAAAKKYNLHPSEYRPYPNDGLGFGDYPHLPDSPIEAKDPYYPYDFPEHRRNFNEPVRNISLTLWCPSNQPVTDRLISDYSSMRSTSSGGRIVLVVRSR